jgi:hypothetical protein
MITKKISTYEIFASEYPGYGGFLPWIAVNADSVTPTADWTQGIPALDNGQLFWAAYGLTHVLEQKYPEQVDLIARWNNFWMTMSENSATIFYEGNGKIRSVASISDITKPVEENTYANGGSNCENFDNPCYLDDPYEGELFAVMMYLFAPLAPADRDQIWIAKRDKLQAADVFVTELNEHITVQKGWWFSAHEQWKYLFLPYLQSDINKRVFLNGEKARTWDAKESKLPGMFASVTSAISSNADALAYFSDCGVQSAAYEKVGHRQVVTPYSTMPLFLADQASAAVWYHNMLSGPAGQTKYGSIEALDISGTKVSPMTTWDSKITTVVAIMGGLSDIIADKMQKDMVLDSFLNVVNTEWSAVFGDI